MWQLDRGRNLDQLLFWRCPERPCLRMRLAPVFRPQNAKHGDLIAGLKFRTAQAILPCFQRQNAALHHVKTYLLEELDDIREGENGIQLVLLRFGCQRLDQTASDAVGLCTLMHGERADLANGWAIEVQRAASQQFVTKPDHREIADALRHLEFRAGQHDAFRRITVDQVEDWWNVMHYRLTNGKWHLRRLLDKRVRI